MFGTNVGQLEYDARIRTRNLKADAAEADAIASKTGQNLGSSMEKAKVGQVEL